MASLYQTHGNPYHSSRFDDSNHQMVTNVAFFFVIVPFVAFANGTLWRGTSEGRLYLLSMRTC